MKDEYSIKFLFVHRCGFFFVKCMYLCFARFYLFDGCVFSSREDSRVREDVLCAYWNKKQMENDDRSIGRKE